MNILTIAAREGNRAYEEAEGNEAKAEAYYRTHKATLERGKRAEEILAAGLVSPNGKAGTYYVKSQNGGGTYTVDLPARECDCPDHQHRGAFCKHLQAAELFAAANTEGNARDLDAELLEWAAGVANWYNKVLIESIAHHGLCTRQQINKWAQLKAKYPTSELLEAVRARDLGPRDPAPTPEPVRIYRHGLSEADWQRADYYNDWDR